MAECGDTLNISRWHSLLAPDFSLVLQFVPDTPPATILFTKAVDPLTRAGIEHTASLGSGET